MNIPDVNKFDVPEREECEALTNNSANPHRRLSSPFSKMKSNIPNRIGKEIEVSTEDADSKSFADVQIRLKNSDKRIMSKNGHINYAREGIDRKQWNYFIDIFTTLLEANLGWTLFAFIVTYFGSWLLFAAGWYLIQFLHHDLDPVNVVNANNGTWKACVIGIDSFTKAFLFSVETQHTTGYGFHELTDECPQAILLFCIQSIAGIILEGIMVGLIFVKVSRAKRRRATLMFSRHAVISECDNGKLCFMFRVADMRKNPLIEPRIRAQFIQKRLTAEGDLLRTSQTEFPVHGEGECSNRLFLLWPATVIHEINPSSPFYPMVMEEFSGETSKFEVVIILEGTLESTGQPTQARTSYLPNEILRGHYFQQLSEFSTKSPESGERVIDYSMFHKTFCPSEHVAKF